MRPVIMITMGDPSGIGPEIIAKALLKKEIYAVCKPVVAGVPKPLKAAMAYFENPLQLKRIHEPEDAEGTYGCIEYICQDDQNDFSCEPGQLNAHAAEIAFQCIVSSIQFAMKGSVAAVVTAPINKEALHMSGHVFSGHTEIFAHYTHTDHYAMMLISGALRVIHCTTHVSMRRACELITKDRVHRTIRLAWNTLEAMKLPARRIAVAGLNAHCSENGLFGLEEEKEIIPAIQAAQAEGIDVTGPVPPDTVFVKAAGGQYDAVVAMYHDQGHIPIKLLGFRMDESGRTLSGVSGVNVTIGLPIIRTSVDHGTAFDLAGKNLANPESMIESILLAVTMTGE